MALVETPSTEDAVSSALQAAQAGAALFDYRDLVPLTLIQALAAVAREARQEAGLKQVRIAAALDADQSTVARFERGGMPRDLEAMMRAYEAETGVPLHELGIRAIERAWMNGNHNGRPK